MLVGRPLTRHSRRFEPAPIGFVVLGVGFRLERRSPPVPPGVI
jgi:hypothetical protein